jgi:hypothetical protein
LEAAALERERLSEAVAQKSEDLLKQQRSMTELSQELELQRLAEAKTRQSLEELAAEKDRLTKLVELVELFSPVDEASCDFL